MNLKKSKPGLLILAALSLLGAPFLLAASQRGTGAVSSPALEPVTMTSGPVSSGGMSSDGSSNAPTNTDALLAQNAQNDATKAPDVAHLERLARQRYLAENPLMRHRSIKLGSYEEVAHMVTLSQWNALNTKERRMTVNLIRSAHKGVMGVLPCFAPGTDLRKVQAFEGISNSLQFFRTAGYWTNTASGPHAQGEPITLTWSIVPDGTAIASGAGEDEVASDLVERLNAIYGSKDVWLPLFRRVFARYTEISGIRYVEEPTDDGAPITGTLANPGVLGVRGDVRISAHPIDGAYNILAYDYFPNISDMVIDSDDLVTTDPRLPGFFTDTSQDSLGLRNMLAHEHGHGLGFAHVCPINHTKLMEPEITYNFDGPQLDDIQNAQRGYGDTLEENDVLSAGTPLGTLSTGKVSKTLLSIDSIKDEDFFRFSTSGGKKISVTVTPIGGSYLEGPQNNDGSCSTGTTFDARMQRDLKVSVLNKAGDILATADNTGLGGAETLDPTVLPQNTGPFSVRVYGDATDATDVIQMYNIDITLADYDEGPGLSISDPTVAEGNSVTTNMQFGVSLSKLSTNNVTVQYATSDGTATEPSDYQSTSGTLTIPAGQISGVIIVPVKGDTLDEENETLNMTLSKPTKAFILDAVGVGTIKNDDGGPGLSVNNTSVKEGDVGVTKATFTVTLASTSTKTATVRYTTSDVTATAGADYDVTSGIVSFAPGERSKTFTVNVIGDTSSEPDETFLVTLSNAVNAFVDKTTGTGTIIDDDQSALNISDATVTEGDPGGAAVKAVFNISLPVASGKEVKVNYATVGGTAKAGVDFESVKGTLIFAPGALSKNVTVPIIGDSIYEGAETFTLKLSSAVNTTISDGEGLGTINDNDVPPTVSVKNVSVTEGNSSTVKAIFTVKLSKAVVLSSQAVKVNYATVNGTAKSGFDYIATKGTLVFAPGESSKTVAVTVYSDFLNEANETFLFKLSSLTGATFGDAEATGTIVNDDALPELSITNTILNEGDSGSTNAEFDLLMPAASGQEVRVKYVTTAGTATEGVDYTYTAGTVTFAPGETIKTITVPVKGDTLHEQDETFALSLNSVTNAKPTSTKGLATIIDNDAEPTISIDDASVVEGNSGNTDLFFSIKLSTFSGVPIKVNYATKQGTATEGVDYLSKSGTLVFPPGEIVKIVKVTVKTDKVVEGDEEFRTVLSSADGATIEKNVGVGTIVNDDSAATISAGHS